MMSISQMAFGHALSVRVQKARAQKPEVRFQRDRIDKAAEHFFCLRVTASAERTREVPVTLAGKLSVVTAYLAIAFVGAIVLGVI
jgi:hypothetical protein